MPKLFSLRAMLLMLVLFSPSALSAVWEITYPKLINQDDRASQYPVDLLRLALQKTGVKHSLQSSKRVLNQRQFLYALAEGQQVNVIWSMTDEQREQDLLPIRIPIFRGLIGWRLLMAHERLLDNSAFFSVGQIYDMPMVQGIDWPDVKILQTNGFQVLSAKDYKAAAEVFRRSPNSFFPRSVIEVQSELNGLFANDNIRLEPNYVLHYPTAAYFFVNKSNRVLARLLRTGLELALADGSAQALFAKYYAHELRLLDLSKREILFLDNPLLPTKTPVDDERLWYTTE